jgi:hypothetical protein
MMEKVTDEQYNATEAFMPGKTAFLALFVSVFSFIAIAEAKYGRNQPEQKKSIVLSRPSPPTAIYRN